MRIAGELPIATVDAAATHSLSLSGPRNPRTRFIPPHCPVLSRTDPITQTVFLAGGFMTRTTSGISAEPAAPSSYTSEDKG